MRRRALLLGAMATGGLVHSVRNACAAAPMPPVPASHALAFRVMRKGSEIGRHNIAFQVSGARLVAHIEVALQVAFGPIPLYRYHHEAYEVWEDGQFSSLDSTTDNNGKPMTAHVRRVAGGLVAQAAGAAPTRLAADTIPFTHWNEAVTRSPLLDPQDGVAVTEQVAARGATTVALADGQSIPTHRFDFTGHAVITDWYDANHLWAGLHATADDGSIVVYERI